MAMNLIQIQNKLRDLPAGDPRSMQLLTAFANGQNPQVPPFIALAELNRRKQMEQSKAQAPEQTVKDKIEQEARMMQTNAGRQQEAMQNMGRQAMMANAGKIPASTPSTQAADEEEGMAAGGIARLNSDFNFAGGGIVAFAKPTEENNNSLVVDPMLGTSQDTSGTDSDDRSIFEKLGIFNPENRRALEKAERAPAIEAARKEEDKVKQVEAQIKEEDAKEKPKGMTADQIAQMLMGGRGQGGAPSAGGPRPAGGAPAGGDIYSMLVNQLKGDKFEAGPDLEKFMEAQRLKNPDMQGKAGGKLETMIEEIRRQDLADRAEAKANEERRQSTRFLDVLTGAGQGMGRFNAANQSGKAGLLNLLGGIGQQYKAMGEEDIQRSKEQKALERQQNLAYAEMMGRIEDTRRAEARGDAKEIFKAKQDEAKAKQDYNKARTDALYHGASAEEQRRHNISSEGIQRLQASQQGRDIIRERAAVLALDPANKGKSPTELMQMAATLATGVQAENAETQRLKAVDAAWEKQFGTAEKIASLKPESQEAKSLMAQKVKFYQDRGVNFGGGGGGGGVSAIDTSQFNVREKGSK